MLRHIAAFEWRFHLKSPVFWIGCGIFFLLTFGAVTVDQIQIGSRGNVHVNSPFAILQTLGIMSVFAVFVHVSMVAGAVLRDDETGFAPILRSTRIGKGEYLVGRFVGAAAAAFMVLACVPLAVLLGSLMPWLDPEKVGPLQAVHYLYALFVFGLPTLLIVAATFFALATVTRSMMWSYVAAVALLVGYFVMRGLLRDPQYDRWSALLDPFGMAALSITTRYWTATERNTLLPELTGQLLANRLLWLGVAAALFTLAWRLFRFDQGSGVAGPTPKSAARAVAAPLSPKPGALPSPTAHATPWTALRRLARFDMGYVFTSPAFFVLLGIGMLNGGASAVFHGEFYGSGPYPVTRLMVQALLDAFSIMPIIIAIYYGGELVWRDRQYRMHEIVDATPAPNWTHLLPKVTAIALVLAATNGAGVLVGIGVQLFKGHLQFEIGHYLLWFWLPTLISAVQLAVLSVFVQVLVPQKFVGWGVMLLFLVGAVALSSAGFEHNLYQYGGTSPVPLSDMNGMGRFWRGAAWFQAYWTSLAVLLCVFAHVLWPRGTSFALRPRLSRLRHTLRGGTLALAVGAFACWLAIGGWIFYNTNVLNQYRPAPALDALLADAERTLLPFEHLPLPRITAVTLDVQLYPREARAVTSGRYRIENRSGEPIERLFVTWPLNLQLDRFELPGARLDEHYARFPVRRYVFEPALQPGEAREITFATTLEERGFPNSAPLTRIVANGSFLDNSQFTPSLGIDRSGFLKDRAKRRKHGLAPDLRPPTLEDERGRKRSFFRADSDWVQADITITTDADQTPIAPGQILSDTTSGGRRSVHFRPDAPINHFFSIQSARYQARRDKLGEIDLAVYFHPGHEYNVDRMLKAMKASLALFSEAFSPYQFRQARILEFPGYADFAQSFANTIPYSENIGFITRLTDPQKIDIATYVTAHEIAHQWWGHQLVPGDQQGSTMLVETFAQYSALLVMDRLYGKDQIRRFLKYELDRYLRARGGEVVEELPLARVENQPYVHYAKGSLAMYWLKDVVGEQVVNGALAEMLRRHAFKAAPYPNTLDFLTILRERAGPAHDALITDLFERITTLDLKATGARATRRADGRYDVSIDIEARKLYADGQGRETEAELDEPVDIGAFAVEPGKEGFDADSILAFERRSLKSGRQTLNLITAKAPAWVGVDPYNKRIDRNSGDNLVQVTAP